MEDNLLTNAVFMGAIGIIVPAFIKLAGDRMTTENEEKSLYLDNIKSHTDMQSKEIERLKSENEKLWNELKALGEDMRVLKEAQQDVTLENKRLLEEIAELKGYIEMKDKLIGRLQQTIKNRSKEIIK